MQSLNPTRIVARRGRDTMVLGALILLGGLVVGGLGLLVLLLFSSQTFGIIFLLLAVLVVLVGIAFMVRGLSLRMENEAALVVAEGLARQLNARFTFVRNISRRGLGYVDAILIGPPGALVFRIVDQPGIFLNEGADWLERRGGRPFMLSRLNATRECVTDVVALRKYFAQRQLGQVPVFGLVVFTAPNVQLSARQPAVPIADARTLPQALRVEYLVQDRIDAATVERAVNAIYQ